LGRVYVNKAKIYVGELRGEDCHWFVVLFHWKWNIWYGFVKLIQELSSFGFISFYIIDGGTKLDWNSYKTCCSIWTIFFTNIYVNNIPTNFIMVHFRDGKSVGNWVNSIIATELFWLL
jgi:hypothetical protein